jgi:hypothetical protein
MAAVSLGNESVCSLAKLLVRSLHEDITAQSIAEGRPRCGKSGARLENRPPGGQSSDASIKLKPNLAIFRALDIAESSRANIWPPRKFGHTVYTGCVPCKARTAATWWLDNPAHSRVACGRQPPKLNSVATKALTQRVRFFANLGRMQLASLMIDPLCQLPQGMQLQCPVYVIGEL